MKSTIHILVAIGWEYNDNYHEPSFANTNYSAFRTAEKAKSEQRRLTLERIQGGVRIRDYQTDETWGLEANRSLVEALNLWRDMRTPPEEAPLKMKEWFSDGLYVPKGMPQEFYELVAAGLEDHFYQVKTLTLDD